MALPTGWLGAAVWSSVGLSMSENVGKEFSVCVISVICHCLPGAVQRTVARTTSRVNEAPGPTDK